MNTVLHWTVQNEICNFLSLSTEYFLHYGAIRYERCNFRIQTENGCPRADPDGAEWAA